eukprot:scaffold34810_cov183-Amphora_coffeaeformis.AAC.1
MDFGTIKATLAKPLDQTGAYKNVSSFSKDVNRVFGNVLKVWNPGDAIADAARNLQLWWTTEWSTLVPMLMTMKPDEEGDKASCNSETEDILSQSACVNNERGTDYQEQLGMPDEENMRHWSHHYSTDTVDDPVFRAAMRGCDAVSFVFGLEVTWSLIQQRQQEEEEAEAAKVLEEMQENGQLDNRTNDEDSKPAAVEDDDSESDDESTSRKPATRNMENVPTKPASSDLEDSDDSSEEEGDNEVPTAANNSVATDSEDSDEDVVDTKPVSHDLENSNDSDEESTESPSVASGTEGLKQDSFTSAKQTAVVLELSSDEDEVESRAEKSLVTKKASKSGVTDSLASVAPSDDPPTPPNQWKCGACTFLNKMANRKCEVCLTGRPNAARLSSSSL